MMRNCSPKFSISFLHFVLLILSSLDGTVLSTTMSSVASAHHHPKRIHLPRAIDASRKFGCREPQSRAYNLRDLMLTLYQNPGESVSQPVYIVLKRCDSHSGCCMSPDMSCTPVQSSIYYEDFEIEIWSLEGNVTRKQWIRVEQHGRCTCDITSINERHQLDHERPNVTIL